MQNEERKRKRSKFFEFNQCYKQKINNTSSHELQRQNDIECYDKVMESHLNYPFILYTYVKKFRERLKYFSAKSEINTKKYQSDDDDICYFIMIYLLFMKFSF